MEAMNDIFVEKDQKDHEERSQKNPAKTDGNPVISGAAGYTHEKEKLFTLLSLIKTILFCIHIQL